MTKDAKQSKKQRIAARIPACWCDIQLIVIIIFILVSSQSKLFHRST